MVEQRRLHPLQPACSQLADGMVAPDVVTTLDYSSCLLFFASFKLLITSYDYDYHYYISYISYVISYHYCIPGRLGVAARSRKPRGVPPLSASPVPSTALSTAAPGCGATKPHSSTPPVLAALAAPPPCRPARHSTCAERARRAGGGERGPPGAGGGGAPCCGAARAAW